MPLVLDMVQGTLAPTVTYARRDWRWLPHGPGEAHDGTLTIILQHSRRAGAKIQLSHYLIEEERDLGLPEGIRSFLFENLTEPDKFGPFRCIVGGLVETCGCEAGAADLRRRQPTSCKHRDALSAMIAEGVIS